MSTLNVTIDEGNPAVMYITPRDPRTQELMEVDPAGISVEVRPADSQTVTTYDDVEEVLEGGSGTGVYMVAIPPLTDGTYYVEAKVSGSYTGVEPAVLRVRPSKVHEDA
jgi:hypothetical protein